jgi:hypothetical protein
MASALVAIGDRPLEHPDLLGVHGNQLGGVAGAIAVDQRELVALQRQRAHALLVILEAGVLAVGLAVDQVVQRVVHGADSAALVVTTIKLAGQLGDGLGEQGHAGAQGADRQRRLGVDQGAGRALPADHRADPTGPIRPLALVATGGGGKERRPEH